MKERISVELLACVLEQTVDTVYPFLEEDPDDDGYISLAEYARMVLVYSTLEPID